MTLYVNGVKQGIVYDITGELKYYYVMNAKGWDVMIPFYPSLVGEVALANNVYPDTFKVCDGCVYSEDEIIDEYNKGYTVPFAYASLYAKTLIGELAKIEISKGEQQKALMDKISQVISALQLNPPDIGFALIELNDFYTILRNMKKQGKIDENTYLFLYIYYANIVEGLGETPKPALLK